MKRFICLYLEVREYEKKKGIVIHFIVGTGPDLCFIDKISIETVLGTGPDYRVNHRSKNFRRFQNIYFVFIF